MSQRSRANLLVRNATTGGQWFTRVTFVSGFKLQSLAVPRSDSAARPTGDHVASPGGVAGRSGGSIRQMGVSAFCRLCRSQTINVMPATMASAAKDQTKRSECSRSKECV